MIDQAAQRDVGVKQSCDGIEILPGCTHPGTEYSAVRVGPMVGMVRYMFQRVGIDKPLERQQRAGEEETHCKVTGPGHQSHRRATVLAGVAA